MASDAVANATKERGGALLAGAGDQAGEAETETETEAAGSGSFFGTLDVSAVDNEHQAWRLFQEGKKLFDNGALDAAERKLVKSVQVRTRSQRGPVSPELASVYVMLSQIATAKGDARAAKSGFAVAPWAFGLVSFLRSFSLSLFHQPVCSFDLFLSLSLSLSLSVV